MIVVNCLLQPAASWVLMFETFRGAADGVFLTSIQKSSWHNVEPNYVSVIHWEKDMDVEALRWIHMIGNVYCTWSFCKYPVLFILPATIKYFFNSVYYILNIVCSWVPWLDSSVEYRMTCESFLLASSSVPPPTPPPPHCPHPTPRQAPSSLCVD